jgi:hypothetical protein
MGISTANMAASDGAYGVYCAGASV